MCASNDVDDNMDENNGYFQNEISSVNEKESDRYLLEEELGRTKSSHCE